MLLNPDNKVFDIYKDILSFNDKPYLSYKSLFLSWMSGLVEPKTYIEVGVHRLSNFAFLNSVLPSSVEMVGFDLFDESPPGEHAPPELPFSFQESNNIVDKWDRKVSLIKGNTKKTLSGNWNISIKNPVLVYLDGGHSYETVKSDFLNVYNKIENGFIIMDDWVNPNVLGNGYNKYGFRFNYDKNKNFRFMDGTWKFAKELEESEVNVTYISDFFCDIELDWLGIVQKK